MQQLLRTWPIPMNSTVHEHDSPQQSDVMQHKNPSSRGLYFPAVLLFTLLWVCLSLLVGVMVANVDDPPLTAPVSLSLKIADAITLFPMSKILPWVWTRTHLHSDTRMMIQIFGLFL